MTFEIWGEGYLATGMEGKAAPAKLFGTADGGTFAEACIALLGNDSYFNAERLTYWGCRLFDNETDARKLFG